LQSESARKEFSRIIDGFGRVFDDDLWPLLPEYLDLAAGLTFSFPTSERLRSQARRHASKVAHKIGRPIDANALFTYEYFSLKRLRKLQSHYQQLADFLKKADRDDLLLGLGNALHYAFWLGQQCPAEGITAKATAARSAKKGRPPKWATFADDLLENKPGLPSSADGKAKKIRPDLVEKLKEREIERGRKIRPPSVRTLRAYIATKKKVGK
jgi:hypothetical protein